MMATTALLTNQYGTQDQQPNQGTQSGPLNLNPVQPVQQTQAPTWESLGYNPTGVQLLSDLGYTPQSIGGPAKYKSYDDAYSYLKGSDWYNSLMGKYYTNSDKPYAKDKGASFTNILASLLYSGVPEGKIRKGIEDPRLSYPTYYGSMFNMGDYVGPSVYLRNQGNGDMRGEGIDVNTAGIKGKGGQSWWTGSNGGRDIMSDTLNNAVVPAASSALSHYTGGLSTLVDKVSGLTQDSGRGYLTQMKDWVRKNTTSDTNKNPMGTKDDVRTNATMNWKIQNPQKVRQAQQTIMNFLVNSVQNNKFENISDKFWKQYAFFFGNKRPTKAQIMAYANKRRG